MSDPYQIHQNIVKIVAQNSSVKLLTLLCQPVIMPFYKMGSMGRTLVRSKNTFNFSTVEQSVMSLKTLPWYSLMTGSNQGP